MGNKLSQETNDGAIKGRRSSSEQQTSSNPKNTPKLLITECKPTTNE